MRKLLVGLLVFMMMALAVPEVESEERYWIKMYSEGDRESGNAVAVAPDGDLIIVGTRYSKGNFYDAWVIRLDPNGGIKWQKSYGGEDNDEAKAVAVAENGDIIVAGVTQSHGEGNGDIWILRLDTWGNVKWQKTYGSKEAEDCWDVAVTKEGNIIVVGKTENSVWILMLHGDGNIGWQKKYDGYVSSYESSMALANNGDIIIATSIRHPEWDDSVWVLRLNHNGSVIWQKAYGGDSTYYAYDVAVVENGDIIVAGQTYDIKDKCFKAWVIRLNANGNIQWQKSYGSDKEYNEMKEYRINAIEVLKNGDIILTGTTERKSLNPNAWISKIDSNGNIKWQKSYGSLSNTEIKDVVSTANGNVFAVGVSALKMLLIKIPPDGRFPDCENYKDSKALAKNTNVKIGSVKVSIRPIFAKVNRTKAQVKNTNAEVKTKCSMVLTTPTHTPKGSTIETPTGWARSYGGKYYDEARTVAVTPEGDIIAAGTTESFGTGNYDLWVIRLDSEGNIKWQKTYGGKGDDSAYAVAVASNGDIIVAGSTSSFGAGDYDLWVLRLDKNGNIRWEMTYGGEYGEGALGVALALNGDIIVAGYTGGFGAGDYDVWMLRLDSAGNVKWQKTYGGEDEDVALDVAIVKSSDIVVGGYTYSFGAGKEDAWVLYLDGNGNVKWQKTYGREGEDEIWAISATENGDIVAAGYTTSFGAGNEDVWVLRIDDRGEIIWEKTYGGEYGDIGMGIEEINRKIVVTGITQNFDVQTVGALVLYLDEMGNMLWGKVCEGGEMRVWEVSATDSSVVTAGYIKTPEGNEDLWVLKLSPEGASQCAMCWKVKAESEDTSAKIRNSEAQVENTKGEVKGSRARVKVSDAESNVQCTLESMGKQPVKETISEQSESWTATEETYPTPEEEEEGGICGPGIIILLGLIAIVLRR
ncbi:NHL repeat-containing protein [Thermococcus paralvinellae]|uniref:Uncharacterized protein n=1 Tax=Thermococcus paralvinellae TaxID=582419 RepID=W0I3G2_9EURY|nr:hypothetical protein [Thermococcus paralvinellae]AHF80611.1 hypothetical protein TES1_1229 [Thermococcus paralvinellae]